MARVAPFASCRPNRRRPDRLRKAVYNAQAWCCRARSWSPGVPRFRAAAQGRGAHARGHRQHRPRSLPRTQGPRDPGHTANVRSNAEYLLAGLLLLYRRGIGSSLIGERHADIRLGRELNGSVVGSSGWPPQPHPGAHAALAGRQAGRLRPGVHHSAHLAAAAELAGLMSTRCVRAGDVRVALPGLRQRQGAGPLQAGPVWVGISRSHLFDAMPWPRADRWPHRGLHARRRGSRLRRKGTPLHDWTTCSSRRGWVRTRARRG